MRSLLENVEIVSTTRSRMVLDSARNENSENVVDPTYRMDRHLQSVQQLWREYQDKIISMDEKHGSSWRKSESDRKHYTRRMKIIHSILRIINSGSTEDDAILIVERYRGQKSLRWLSDNIGNMVSILEATE